MASTNRPIKAAILLLLRDNDRMPGQRWSDRGSMLLRVLPRKRLPRQQKVGGMTSGKNPWDVPGSSLVGADTPLETITRELQRGTGLDLEGARSVGTAYIPEAKCIVHVFRTSSQQTGKARNHIAELEWVPWRRGRRDACYRLRRALHVAERLCENSKLTEDDIQALLREVTKS